MAICALRGDQIREHLLADTLKQPARSDGLLHFRRLSATQPDLPHPIRAVSRRHYPVAPLRRRPAPHDSLCSAQCRSQAGMEPPAQPGTLTKHSASLRPTRHKPGSPSCATHAQQSRPTDTNRATTRGNSLSSHAPLVKRGRPPGEISQQSESPERDHKPNGTRQMALGVELGLHSEVARKGAVCPVPFVIACDYVGSTVVVSSGSSITV